MTQEGVLEMRNGVIAVSLDSRPRGIGDIPMVQQFRCQVEGFVWKVAVVGGNRLFIESPVLVIVVLNEERPAAGIGDPYRALGQYIGVEEVSCLPRQTAGPDERLGAMGMLTEALFIGAADIGVGPAQHLQTDG